MLGIILRICGGLCGQKRGDSSSLAPDDVDPDAASAEPKVVQPTMLISSQSDVAPSRVPARLEPSNSSSSGDKDAGSVKGSTAVVSPPSGVGSSRSPAYIDTLKNGFILLAKKAEPFLEGTPFKIPIAVLNSFIDLTGTVSDNASTLRALLEQLALTFDAVNGAMDEASSDVAREGARKLFEFLRHEMDEFEALQKRCGIIKILESDEDIRTIEAAVRRIDGQLGNFQLAVMTSIEKKTDLIDKKTDLSREQSTLQILYRATAKDAAHDSGERFSPPMCHPQTRTEILRELSEWAATDDPSTQILWLHAPAGAGKSAIAQTLCQQLAADNRPVASFFFKRGDPSRGESMKLFPTIAYQLAYIIAEFRADIVPRIDGSPHIFDKSLPTQLDALILEPSHQLPATHILVVVIDGLDECTGENRQQEIVRSIARGLVGNPTPLRFLIASRPEPHIAELFQEPNLQNTHQQMNIAPSFTDIHTYLRDEFGRISRDHKMMVSIRVPWPSQEVLEHLIKRSSGYFIYAATVIEIINDPDFRPTDRLSIIMGMAKPKHTSPYAALDQLYTQILEDVPSDSVQLLPILAVLAARYILPMFQIEQLLGLESGDVWLTLRRAHSVIDVPSQPTDTTRLRPHHASFIDFLQDEARSGAFFTGPGSIHHQHLAGPILDALSYTYQDQYLNAVGHVAWEFSSPDIIQFLPTEGLVARFRLVNPDFILAYVENSAEAVLKWLKATQPAPPEDLIQVGEAYHFLAACDDTWCSALKNTSTAFRRGVGTGFAYGDRHR
ncbi:hypothetical protein FB45DRAFT_56455 [Roridomyces roridus]|uniref:Nephrocystin 3-like N-terminal domain-containing protein n=1 Tax=Roridomyces roridus TaxID=1738132 RepID=A0AAD7FJ70_9AGAR|nr:hypothetical protein FB45DRAFT_56455 [Roridomyces roridus]